VRMRFVWIKSGLTIAVGWLARAIDLSDIVFLIGVLLLAWGVWQLSPPASAITIGLLFIAITLYPRFRRKEK
jgi:di/tricarboxylate transporter